MMTNHAKTAPESLSFIQRFVWMLAGEGVVRISRLVTAIVLARYLTPLEFGIAALVLSVDEITKVMTRNGIGQKIIQCQDSALAGVCQRAYQLNWWVHIGLFILQIVIAAPLAHAFEHPELQSLLTVLAFTYLIYPLAMVQVNLLQRQQDMKKVSLFFTTQVGLDNLLTAVFALSGLGIWAIILPKLIVAPLWVVLFRSSHSWRYNRQIAACDWSEFSQFSLPIFGAEILKTLRLHADRLLIGVVLGLDALGVYYFAVNAGSGLSFALIKAYSTVALPDACQQARQGINAAGGLWMPIYRSARQRFSLCVVPIIGLQLCAAPWYVPIVFGAHWAHAIPVLMILCAASICQGYIEMGSQILRAQGKTQIDFSFNVMATIAFFVVIILSCVFALIMGKQLIWIALAILMHSAVTAVWHMAVIHKAIQHSNQRLYAANQGFKLTKVCSKNV